MQAALLMGLGVNSMRRLSLIARTYGVDRTTISRLQKRAQETAPSPFDASAADAR